MGSEATFGALLRRARRQAGLSQEELAARAYVSTRAISDLERGVNSRPRRHTAIALADGLGLDGDERRAFELHARPEEEPPPVCAVAARARPPLTLDAFVDDGSNLERLVALMSDRRHRAITLLGPGGVGKTRLALEMARCVDGPVAFVPLSSLSEPSLVAATVCDALGAEHGPARTHLQSLVEHLAPQTLTLVLDNMEQVVEAAGDVATLLQSCAGLRIVATSRLPLRIAGELRFEVRPLATSPDGTADPPGVRLFLARAAASGFDASDDPARRAAVAELCSRLDGLPLAIELAAARARIVSPPEMLRHLDQMLDLLRTGRSDAPAQHRSMSAALEWSFRLLPPPAQEAFAALGVFATGASAEAAMAVWGLPATATPTFFDLVQVLAEAHLVSVDSTDPTALRIDMFETNRQFARQRLGESGGAPLAQQRLARWAVALVERAEPELSRPDALEWLDRLDRELPNLRAAGRHLAEHDDDDAVDTGLRLVAGLQRYWDIRSRWTEGVTWLRDALARPGGAAASRGKAHKALGVMHRCMGELEAAEAEMRRAVEMYTSAGDQRGLALCLNNLGVVAIDRAQHGSACESFRRALELCATNGDDLPTGTLLNNLGLATTETGALREAFGLCRESRRRLLAQGDLHAACWAEDNMATVLTLAGHPSWAIPLHQVTVRRRIAFGDENGFMWSLEALAAAWTASGQADRAGRTLGFLAAHRRRLGTIAAPYLLELTRRRSDAVAQRVGPDRFAELWDEGVGLDPAVVRGWFAD